MVDTITVLRNRSSRKDAAYAVRVQEGISGKSRIFEVWTYWGPWATYEQNGINALQRMMTGWYFSQSTAHSQADRQIGVKRGRGYIVQSSVDYSQMTVPNPQPPTPPTGGPKPEPKPTAPKWAPDSMVSRLKART